MGVEKLISTIGIIFLSLTIILLPCSTGVTASKQNESIPQPNGLSPVSHERSIPILVFEDSIYDFGISGPKEKITHTFKFTNYGTVPLQITRIHPSCGCMVALVSSKDIPPGGHGEINATFETKEYESEQVETITVYSNDTDKPETELIIRGKIKTEIAIVPQGLHLGNIEKGKTAVGRVKIFQLSQKPLILEKVEVNERFLTIKTSRFREENQRGINIDVTLRPEAQVGELREVITFHTNLKKRPRIDIPIWANILGKIIVQPKALSFGTVSKGDKIPQTIILTSSEETRLRVLKVTCDLPFIHVSPFFDEKHNIVKIYANVDKISPAGRCSGRIDIYTDDPDQGVFHVPVNGVIQRRIK